jgi:hypothetical protein
MSGSASVPISFGPLTGVIPLSDLDSNYSALVTYLNDTTNRENIGVDNGAANAYVIALTPAFTSYGTGQIFSFIPLHANTGASTVNASALGFVTLYKGAGSALASGDLLIGTPALCLTDGTNVALLNPQTSSISRRPNIVNIAVSGTYTPTAGMTAVDVQVFGATGGGGGATGGNSAGGGGGGGYARGRFSAATIGASQVATIGAAGTAGTGGANGGAGGTTSLGALLSATGGGQGLNNVNNGFGGAGGTGTGGDVQWTGQNGSNGTATNATIPGGMTPGGPSGGVGGQNGGNGSAGVAGLIVITEYFN